MDGLFAIFSPNREIGLNDSNLESVESNLQSIRKEKIEVNQSSHSFSYGFNRSNGNDSHSHEGKHLLVLGEVYHHPILGFNPNAASILGLYVQKGEQELHELNGAYAIVLYDEKQEKLAIWRDKGGIQPLFYSERGQSLIFSSNLRTLVECGLVERTLDPIGFRLGITMPAPPQPYTVYKDCKALNRGHRLTFEDGKLKIDSYWDFADNYGRFKGSFNEAVEEFHSKLKHAIHVTGYGKDGLGTTISGGVDSAYLSALMSQEFPGVKALTYALKSPEFSHLNEDQDAQLTAQKHDLNHIVRHFSFDEMIEHLRPMVRLFEQPGVTLAPYYFINKVAHEEGLKYLVNGLSADELLGGFRYFKYLDKWDSIRRLKPLINLLPRHSHSGVIKYRKIAGSKNIDEFYTRSFSAFLDDELEALLNLPKFDSSEVIHELYNSKNLQFPDRTTAMVHFMFSNVPNHHIYRFHTFGNYFNVKGLYPFLEDGLMNFCLSLPGDYKVKDGQRKRVIKSAAEPYVDPVSLVEFKKGIVAPVGTWINSDLKDFSQDKLNKLGKRDIVDTSVLNKMRTDLKKKFGGKLFKLVMTELWMEEYYK